jgi:AcrR family transcriptional regulator
MDTRQKILDKALEMFNERGIEYVGLRELSAALAMRVGNVTYYFATKDELVYQIAQLLTQANSEWINEKDGLTMLDFLGSLREVYKNHVRFRGILLSIVHLVKQNPKIAEAFRQSQNVRRAGIGSNLQVLARDGYLEIANEADLRLLVSGISIISRYWISEATINNSQLSEVEEIGQALRLVAKMLMPHATAKGRSDIDEFLEKL